METINLLTVSYSKTLYKLLRQCVNDYFPELKKQDIKIGYIISSEEAGAAKAGRWIILFLPDTTKVEHQGLKWVVVHELCHFIDLHNPNKIFKSKVPKDVWEMWERLEERKELVCDEGRAGRGK